MSNKLSANSIPQKINWAKSEAGSTVRSEATMITHKQAGRQFSHQTADSPLTLFVSSIRRKRSEYAQSRHVKIVGLQGKQLLVSIAGKLPVSSVGKEIAIHVSTGDYVVDNDGWKAVTTLKAKHKDGDVYKARLTADIVRRPNDKRTP